MANFKQYITLPFSRDSVMEELVGEYVMGQVRGKDFGYIKEKYVDVKSFSGLQIVQKLAERGLSVEFKPTQIEEGVRIHICEIKKNGKSLAAGQSQDESDFADRTMLHESREVDYSRLALYEALLYYFENNFEITEQQKIDWISGGARHRTLANPEKIGKTKFSLNERQAVLLEMLDLRYYEPHRINAWMNAEVNWSCSTEVGNWREAHVANVITRRILEKLFDTALVTWKDGKFPKHDPMARFRRDTNLVQKAVA